MQLIFLF